MTRGCKGLPIAASAAAVLFTGVLLMAALLMAGCFGSGSNNTAPGTTDTGPAGPAPGAVTDLVAGAETNSSVRLTWTAPGNDGAVGTAHEYDLRYSLDVITEANFSAAAQVAEVPAPAAAATPETLVVTGLSPGKTYLFAIKAANEVHAWAPLSNLAHGTTAGGGSDTTPPGAVNDLTAEAVDSTHVRLRWSAPGDDGMAGLAHEYDVRYAAFSFTDADWDSLLQAEGEPAPVNSGRVQEMVVHGLLPGTDYSFAIKSVDAARNVSPLSNVATVHTPVTPAAGPAAPYIPSLPGLDLVCIASEDPKAVDAKERAQEQLRIIQEYADFGSPYFDPLALANWVDLKNGCWNYQYDEGGCTRLYHACVGGQTVNDSLFYKGACVTADSVLAYVSRIDRQARDGRFYAYEADTVKKAWTWTWAEDRASGQFRYYDGAPDSLHIRLIAGWTRPTANTYNMIVEAPWETRWVSVFQVVPCLGWTMVERWDAGKAEWWKESNITWNGDGTGVLETFGRDGGSTGRYTW